LEESTVKTGLLSGIGVLGLLGALLFFAGPCCAAGVDYATTIQTIFNGSCTSCHSGGVPAGSLDLTSAVSYNNIVNHAVTGVGGGTRVIPNDPANSVLVQKIDGTLAHTGGIFDSATVVTPVQNWISQGALPTTNPPTVASLNVTAGPAAGGTAVTITGTNFGGTSSNLSVTFGGAAATSVVVASFTTITCVTPAGTAGAVNVVVSTINGPGTLTNGFTYIAAPTVTSVTPNSGLPSTAQSVTIAGTGFLTGAAVTFGGTAATGITVGSATQITCTAPALAAGTVNVVVTTTGGPSTQTVNYTYVAAPTASSVTPNTGSNNGGTTVTVAGTGFVALGTSVTFGGSAAASVNVTGATSLTCTTPAHALGVVDVVVTTGSGSGTLTSGYTYTAAPALTSVTPDNGLPAGGQNVTLAGNNFGAGATVTFGGTPATAVTVVNSTQITCTTPAHALGAVDVVVTTAAGSGTLPNGYTYANAPVVTSVTPSSGPPTGGQNVSIAGSNFFAGATVAFGTAAATGVTVVSTTQITCTTPAVAAGTVDVIVTTASGAGTLASGYLYIAAPTVKYATPNSGLIAGGLTVTVRGNNFVAGGTDVTFGGVAATSVSVSDATTLTCVTPAHAAGAVDVVVTTGSGNGTAAGGFTYGTARSLAPVIGSPATASPNPAQSGQGVSFTVSASDPGNNALTYSWDFGDGTNGASASVSHVYAAAGTFNAVVTVSNASVASTSSVLVYIGQVDFASQVQPLFVAHTCTTCHSPGGAATMGLAGNAPVAGMNLTAGVAYNNLVYAKSTQFPTMFRIVPNDPNSSVLWNRVLIRHRGIPLTDAEKSLVEDWINQGALPAPGVSAPRLLTLKKAAGKAQFTKTGADSAQVQGSFPDLPQGFGPANKAVTLDVGATLDAPGAQAAFTLDAKGMAKTSLGTFKLQVGHSPKAGAAVFRAALRGTFGPAWQDAGVDRTVTVKNAPLSIRVELNLDGTLYIGYYDSLLSSAANTAASFK
jgi:hypothetical protein